MGIHGLYVAHLTLEELAWFDAECKAGRAHRRYNWVGLAKVDLSAIAAGCMFVSARIGDYPRRNSRT